MKSIQVIKHQPIKINSKPANENPSCTNQPIKNNPTNSEPIERISDYQTTNENPSNMYLPPF